MKRDDDMSFMKSLAAINKQKLKPIYVLLGTEHYFIDKCKEKITAVLQKEVHDDLAVYDLQDVPIQHVVTDLETLPFFNDKKLIIASNPGFVKAKPDKTSFTHELTVLENYLQQPAPFSTLVLIAPYEKFDDRKKISKLIKKHAEVIDCNPVNINNISTWIHQLADQEEITLTSDAVDLLEVEFQTNLQVIENELKKLALYVGKGGEVTWDIARETISTSLTHNALELVDAVLNKDLHKAIMIYKELDMMKQEPIGLIALLSYQFRVILQVKILKEKGMPDRTIQGEIKVHPYVIKLASERARRFSYDQLSMIITALMETDAGIKQGLMDKKIGFELLLFKLTAR